MHEVPLEYIIELVQIVKFISKLLILNPDLIEDFDTDAHDNTDIFENVKCVVDKLMRSLEFLQHVNKNDEYDFALAIILDCIRVLIENKFKNEVATILVDFNQSSDSSIHYNKGRGSYMMSRHGFFEKFLRDVELPSGKRLVSKAFVKLWASIIKNPYPTQEMINIVNWIKDIKYSKNEENYEIYGSLLEIYKHCLIKFTTNTSKAQIDMKEVDRDPLFSQLIDLLNNTEIDNILNEVLEIEINQNYEYVFNREQMQFSKLKYVNKQFLKRFERFSPENRLEFCKVISAALDLFYVILEWVYIYYKMLKDKDKNSKLSFSHEFHIKDLEIVQVIYNDIISESSILTDVDENKLILTLISYINFEHNYQMINYQDGNDSENWNPVVSSYSSNSVSSNALRCTWQILKIWDLLPNARKPMLAMYHHQEQFGLLSSSHILSQAVFKPEQAIFLLECLTLCIDSQSGFLNTLFKDDNFSSALSIAFFTNIDDLAK